MERRNRDVRAHCWAKDREHRFVQVNAALAEVLGRPSSGLVGTRDAEIFPDRIVACYRRDDAVVARSGRPVLFFEAPVKAPVSGWITTKTLCRRRGVPVVAGVARPWSEESIHEALNIPGLVGPDEGGVPSWLSRAQRTVHARFRERLLISELANEAGLHPDYFGRRFRQAVGTDLHGLVRKLRAAWCLEQLVERSVPLSTLAHQAGFADQSHLTRSFKQEVGLPPGAFRDRVREAPTR